MTFPTISRHSCQSGASSHQWGQDRQTRGPLHFLNEVTHPLRHLHTLNPTLLLCCKKKPSAEGLWHLPGVQDGPAINGLGRHSAPATGSQHRDGQAKISLDSLPQLLNFLPNQVCFADTQEAEMPKFETRRVSSLGSQTTERRPNPSPPLRRGAGI